MTVGRGRRSKIIIRVFADTGSRCGIPDVLGHWSCTADGEVTGS